MARKLTLAAVVAVAGLVASSAISLGGGNSMLPTKEEGFAPRSVHAVDPASTGVQARAVMTRRGRDNTTLRYFVTDPFTIPQAERDDFFLRCPRRFSAINGFFGSDGGVFADYNSVGLSSPRRWDFGLANTADASADVFAGIVCLRP